MEKLGPDLRESGVLYPEDQSFAQELFDYGVSQGGTVTLSEEDRFTAVKIISRREKALSMEIYSFGKEGEVTLKYVRGRNGWQDAGAEGFFGVFGDTSKIEPEEYHPTVEQRDKLLRIVAEKFLPSEREE